MRKLFTALLAVGIAATAMAQSRSVTANPASGSTVTEISSFTLTSTDPDYPILKVISAGEITVTRDEMTDCGGVTVDNYSTPIKVTLKNPQTAPGTYVIDIPRGAMEWQDAEYNGVTGLDTRIVYVIEGNDPVVKELPVQVSPADGSTLTELTSITIAPLEGVDYLDLISSSGIKVTKDGADFTTVRLVDTSLNYVATLSTPATEPGEYKLIVPEGAFEDSNGNTIAAFEVTYTIGGDTPAGDVVTATPASGSTVSELASIMVVSATDKVLYDFSSASMVSVTKDGEPFGGLSRITDNYDGTFTMTLSPAATEAGEYKVSAQGGTFVYEDDSDVPAFELTYTVAGSVPPVTYKVNSNPESGSTLTEPLKSVTISSGEAAYPSIDILSVNSITVTHDGAPFGGVRATASQAGYVLTLVNEVTEGGEYVIHLPKDSWEMYKADEVAETYESQSFDLDLTYTVDLPGAKYTIEILPTKFVPNSTSGEAVNLEDSYDGKLTEIRFDVNGSLYLNPDSEATTATVACRKNKYSVSVPLRADEPKKASWGNSWSTRFYIALDPALVQDGTYTVSIPRGAFGDEAYKADQMTGTANKAFTMDIEFTGGEPAPEPTVVYDLGIKSTNPAEGKVDISMITWEVTQIRVDAAYNVRPGAEVSLTNEATGYSQTAELREGYAMSGTRTMLFTNGREPNQNGTYVLTIPQGSFGDEEWLTDPEEGHTNPEIKVYYRVTGTSGTDAAYDIQVSTTDPAADGNIDIEKEPLAISFTAPGELSFYPGSKLTLACKDVKYNGVATITGAETADGVTTFTTTLSEPVTVNGTYTLTIPEGVFGDSDYLANCSTGHGNESFTCTFTVTGGEGPKEPVKYDLTPEVTPADKATVLPGQLDVITFVFPAGTRTTSDSARATMKCQAANYYDTAYFVKGEADGTFELRFGTKPTREGVYELTLLQGTFTDPEEAHQNPEITYTFTYQTTGVDSILTDEEAAAGVYTLNGVYVGDTTEGLPAGIYVVKGRKIVKK